MTKVIPDDRPLETLGIEMARLMSRLLLKNHTGDLPPEDVATLSSSLLNVFANGAHSAPRHLLSRTFSIFQTQDDADILTLCNAVDALASEQKFSPPGMFQSEWQGRLLRHSKSLRKASASSNTDTIAEDLLWFGTHWIYM
jgi:hypothetical protein